MNSKLVQRIGAALASFAAFGALAADPGVTATEIKLGQTAPYSGPVSVAAPQAAVQVAYFKMLNDKGGINGRKVNLISLDDGYSPPKTVEVTRKLVEQDEVFLIFGQVGTATAAAVQPYLHAKGVPQLLVSTGASRFNNPSKFPLTIGTAASYRGEAVLFGKYIRQKIPGAKVGIFYQNDDLGRDYLDGITEGLGDQAAATIVSKMAGDVQAPTFDSEVLQLRSSGANVLVIAATAKPTVLVMRKVHDLGWKPQTLLTLASASVTNVMEPSGGAANTGVITTTVYKDPSDTRWANDPEYLEYAAFIAKYLPQYNKNDQYAVSGYIAVQVMAKILQDAGNNLTRENVRKVASNLKDFRPKMAGPDVSFTITPNDYEMFRKLQFMRFNGKSWEPFQAGLN
ncbi:MAG: ABC transporter substrate-binding protein [Pseudomonadota bacterium]